MVDVTYENELFVHRYSKMQQNPYIGEKTQPDSKQTQKSLKPCKKVLNFDARDRTLKSFSVVYHVSTSKYGKVPR